MSIPCPLPFPTLFPFPPLPPASQPRGAGSGCAIYRAPGPGGQEPQGHTENGSYPLSPPCPAPGLTGVLYFPTLGKEGKWVSCQVWSALGQGPVGTSHWTAQPWSMPYRLALGTQPRNNGAIHAAWTLHNDPLGVSPRLDGE